MKRTLTSAIALTFAASGAYAIGLDRSGQDIGVIFEEGTYAQLSYGYVMPSVDGNDVAAFGGGATGNAAGDYSQFALGFKHQVNENVSLALIFDEPYGADISYPTGESVALGGTQAMLDSSAISLIGRYEFGNGFSIHGGARIQSVSAEITLDGAAYGPLAGYNVVLDDSTEVGYLIGAAYEIPDIALRVALTYFSEVDYSFTTTENGAPSLDTDVTAPQAVNLDFQTGIAPDTLLFGQIRWADYEKVILSPAGFAAATGGASLTDIETGFGYTVGVGRRFSDSFAGQISIGYEPEGEDSLVSPLSPTNGNFSIGVGGAYSFDNWEVSGGVRYVWVGDADPETGTPDTARAEFTDNNVVAVGFQVAYTY